MIGSEPILWVADVGEDAAGIVLIKFRFGVVVGFTEDSTETEVEGVSSPTLEVTVFVTVVVVAMLS